MSSKKGMASSLCFPPRFSSSSPSFLPYSPNNNSPSPSRFSFSPARPSFSDSVMDRSLDVAEPIIEKWNPESTGVARVKSLFYENRREAREFVHTVNNLQKAMDLALEEKPGSDQKLVRGQNLMKIAMKRLKKEFYQILTMNRAHLDPESVSTRSSRTSSAESEFEDEEEDDEIRCVDESITEVEDVSAVAMADLKLIAECMIYNGFGKECVNIYKIIRKSIVDEGIYKLGVEKLTSSQIHRMDWKSLDLRITNWLGALRVAVSTLFNGERILSDYVFAASDSTRESCFAEIVKDGATILFGFPEIVTKSSKKSPEKVFRVLDMYTGITNHWPEIDSIFSEDTTIKSQIATSLTKLGDFVRSDLHDFEATILKESSKSSVAGAGIHTLTVDVMNYLTIISDYSNALSEILADSPPPSRKLLPESYFGFSDGKETPAPAISVKVAWLILILLCKLDAKATRYKDVSIAYLFLANNLQYVVVSVQTSNLKFLLGGEWLTKHESKIKQFTSNYERLGWGHVFESLPSDVTAAETQENVKEIFKKFNSSFDQVYKKHTLCVVPDNNLRECIQASIEKKIMNPYRDFYVAHRRKVQKERHAAAVVRYAPEDVRRRLSDLFFGHEDVLGSGSLSSFEWGGSPRT